MARTRTLSQGTIETILQSHSYLSDPKYLEFFALKNQSRRVADLLAGIASSDRAKTSEEFLENFETLTTNFSAAAGFARVHGLISGTEDARAQALNVFEFVTGKANPKLTQGQLEYYLFLLVHFERFEKAQKLADEKFGLSDAAQIFKTAISYRSDPKKWFENFSKLFGKIGGQLAPLTPSADSFRKLSVVDSIPKVTGPSLVSVIMTTYKPNADAEHAINSILQQSYQNFELIIVDDGSGPEFHDLLKRYQAKDDRIRLVLLEKNMGTYGARNIGWLHANGRYLTGQDSDDWSHPLRLELQVKDLDAHPEHAGNWTRGIRVNEHLQLDVRDGNSPIRKGERSVAVSMMIRHSPTLLRLGFFDGVRKAADTEYVQRMKAVFGPNSFGEIPEMLYVIQARYDSLSRTDFAPDWKHPNRQLYATIYARWHRKIVSGREKSFFMPLENQRKFPAPFAFTPEAKRNVSRSFDVVFVGDWYSESTRQTWLRKQVTQALEKKLRVGFVHLDGFYRTVARQGKPDEAILKLYESGAVDFVALDDRNVEVKKLVVPAEYLPFAENKKSNLSVAEVELVSFRDSISELVEISGECVLDLFGSKFSTVEAN